MKLKGRKPQSAKPLKASMQKRIPNKIWRKADVVAEQVDDVRSIITQEE